MLIYDNITTNSPFDHIPPPSRYKSTPKRKRTRSNRVKVVKRGGRLCNKVRKSKKKRVAKKLSVKNLNFLKQLGLRVEKR